ncbi:hypothetical protein MACK_000434 [Theileria orientalis]|uniref:Uncharacterized protein n=1 Tax=Theileria orientalis TaxID=68886 RepID=A0A976QT66_THEOR|nr:hypothetical protein MACK_000434 [Theileria orientalis]
MDCVTKNWSTKCLEMILIRLDSLEEKHTKIYYEIENKHEMLESKIKLIEKYLREVDLVLDKKNKFDEIDKFRDTVQMMIKNHSNNHQKFICSVANSIKDYINENFDVVDDLIEYKRDVSYLDDSYDQLLQLIYTVQVQFNSLDTSYSGTLDDITKSIQIETKKLGSAFQIYSQVGASILLDDVKMLLSTSVNEIKTKREANEDYILNNLEAASNSTEFIKFYLVNKFEDFK